MMLVLASLPIWTCYYLILKKYYPQCSAEWISRLVAITHAVIATKCVEITLFTGPWTFDSLGYPNTSGQTWTMSISASYFIFETLWCIISGTEGVMMMMHHFISVTAMVASLWMESSGSEVCAVLWGSELTNPFLQIRWFLKNGKMYNSTFAYINDWVFFLLFGMVRIGIGSYTAVQMFRAEQTPLSLKIGGYCFFGVSIIWMIKIVMFANWRLFKGRAWLKPQRMDNLKSLNFASSAANTNISVYNASIDNKQTNKKNTKKAVGGDTNESK